MPQKRQPNTLAALRKARGLSQAHAARLVGCRTAQKISDYERGIRLPSLPRAAAFAAAYADSPAQPLPLDRLFPALFARVYAAVARQRQALTRTRKPTYAPRPDTTTVLALYPGTRKVGLAVFTARPARHGPRAQSSDRTGATGARPA